MTSWPRDWSRSGMPNSECEEGGQGWVHKRWQGRRFVFTSILVTSSTSLSADVIYSCFSSSVFPTSGLVVKLHLKACWRTKICFSIDPTLIENNRSCKSTPRTMGVSMNTLVCHLCPSLPVRNNGKETDISPWVWENSILYQLFRKEKSDRPS